MLIDKETSQLLNKARNLGGKGPTIYLTDNTLIRLCIVVATDLNQQHLIRDVTDDEISLEGYYSIPLEWFERSASGNVSFIDMFLLLKQHIHDFETYFLNLCEIHKRRLKFQHILETQRLPQIEPIVPRALLEYGLMPSETLASWLVWRKWLYDIDNRSAQETGYLFEPILAAAIGGVPYSAQKSPIKRADQPSSGRQVDCLDGHRRMNLKCE